MYNEELDRDEYLAVDLEINGLQAQNDIWHMEIDTTHARLDGLHQANEEYERQIQQEEEAKREADAIAW